MKLTTRGRYAVSAMLDLACHGADGPASLAAISRRQGISLSYLEQLFLKLRRGGLVRSVRGPGGGYVLVGSPDTISVADIIRAVDEPIRTTPCQGTTEPGRKAMDQGCQRSSPCIAHDLWVELGDRIHQFLDSVSLGGLTEAHRRGESLVGKGTLGRPA
ncbi:MAG: Rrf2 family transcriptional regulator [Magnetococcales bacterium]|nr:Rrf2 family transcriptional regulator [Magnetococcales bacterium]